MTMNEGHEHPDQALAYALLRVFLGVNIAVHGISRLLDPEKFHATIMNQFAHAPIPHSALYAFALVLPWMEAIIGLLILVGLWTRIALIGGAVVMIALTFGSCLIQDFQAAGIQLTYELVYFVLLFLVSYNRWSVDQLLRRRII
jgi:thiosulfate dehydrogenase [quinone] large subunit